MNGWISIKKLQVFVIKTEAKEKPILAVCRVGFFMYLPRHSIRIVIPVLARRSASVRRRENGNPGR
jgi:hypothetical protein